MYDTASSFNRDIPHSKWLLNGGYNNDSTAIRLPFWLPFGRTTTIQRPTLQPY